MKLHISYLTTFIAVSVSLLNLAPALSQTGSDPLSPSSPNAPTASKAPDNNAPLRPEELIAKAFLQPGGREIAIEIVNNSKRGLLIKGDEATLEQGSTKQTPLKRNDIVPPPKKVQVPGDLLYVTGTFATIGLGQVTQDYVQRKNAPYGLYYGLDADRRKVAGLRFGKRIIFPGETSSGRFYLGKAVHLPIKISIKVTSHPDGEDIGTMVLPVTAGTGPDIKIKEFK
ncbi:MAG: hypothetical protein IPP57_02945 [Candidatus Obscuribacter sp.]|jgi:hypothetical protein|nr:hypothetical protein [Candidatus Obscuribacter sp.]MDQ5965308.1 hypothetical protein [Cyanobacteriota bacterium erpe_2018_sw_39hr_WHONDRS-SW48-000098_B_bin.30]MBK7839698.1 hypothetical protein [Candidatus Obscuribacter sp.]MBK9202399.1 hypothetical protein [Candidatus Obscuribacter sp.]MBK9618810.1 hypothetical protein [Candidatus Obscuribacter sp.]